ncbi:MAG: hypothetical protein ACRDH9_13885 [Actinomycetota bacterium]
MQATAELPEGPEPEFGILMAPVNGRGTWAALKELRAALRALRPDGSPQVLFVDALDDQGRAVNLQDPGAAALVLGYSLKSA